MVATWRRGGTGRRGGGDALCAGVGGSDTRCRHSASKRGLCIASGKLCFWFAPDVAASGAARCSLAAWTHRRRPAPLWPGALPKRAAARPRTRGRAGHVRPTRLRGPRLPLLGGPPAAPPTGGSSRGRAGPPEPAGPIAWPEVGQLGDIGRKRNAPIVTSGDSPWCAMVPASKPCFLMTLRP